MRIKNLLIIAAASLSLMACSQIDDNQIGLKRTYGELENEPVKGLVWYNPWSTDIITFDNKQQKVKQEVSIPTFDQQRASIVSTSTVQLNKKFASKMYRDVGENWVGAIVPQLVKSTQLEVVGKYTATDVIQKQETVANEIRTRLAEKLAKRGITLTDYQLTEVKFSEEYMAAVESKATAVQNAEAEKNKTAAIQEQGRQQVITANAEADSMRVRANALQANPNLIEYERLKVEREAIEAWKQGGAQVPTTVFGGNGAGIPFVNVPMGK
jgi:regulator of protease activity HflC (stomatin/prohibitin superfamily)